MADPGDKMSFDEFLSELKKAVSFEGIGADIKTTFDEIDSASRGLLQTFTQARGRILELRTAIQDAAPGVISLGGSIAEVGTVISQVAEASRRNVVATSEEVEKLYAANKVLGISAADLSEAYLNVGVGIEQVGKSLEESISYIQSIGGNASTVMKSVTNNMDQMNRYQFEGGVIGLTKMAAQASMLRFNMNETFQLADRVLTPEGAIETAAAFQRLGVAAGNLVDPFALMNESINDPSGLQNSLVDVAKQFTYFDEKTKSFKISPQGVLTLKELQNQTGVSAAEMSKLGLAASELDARLSEINRAGLTIASEEDKQYLANIAKMEGGKYMVTLEDNTKKELADLTQPEFNKLIDIQKNAPKTMEDIARASLSNEQVMLGYVAELRNKIVGGIVTAPTIQKAGEKIRTGTTAITGALAGSIETKSVRMESEVFMKNFGNFMKDLGDKNTSVTDALSKYLGSYGTQLDRLEGKFKTTLLETANEVRNKVGDDSVVGKLIDKVKEIQVTPDNKVKQKSQTQPISTLIEGRQTQMREAVSNVTAMNQNTPVKTQVEFAGAIKVDVTAPPGFSDEKIAKAIYDKFNDQNFKDFVANISTQQNPTKSPVERSYPRV